MDDYNAFANFITIKEAKMRKLIPEEISDYFNEQCKCGSEMIISTTLKQIMCCDPLCFIKQGYSLDEYLKRNGIKGLGPESCINVIRIYQERAGRKSFIEMMLSYQDKIHLLGDYGHSVSDAIKVIQSKPITFPNLVASLGLPKLDSKVTTLLRGFSSSESLLWTLVQNYDGNLSYFFDIRNVFDPTFRFYFKFYLHDICYLTDRYPNILKQANRVIKVCVTGSVSPNGIPMNRQNFVAYCNSVATTADGVRLYEIENSTAIHTVSYLICDVPNSHSKYNVAKAREEAEGVKIIYTSSEFVNLLKEGVINYGQQSESSAASK